MNFEKVDGVSKPSNPANGKEKLSPAALKSDNAPSSIVATCDKTSASANIGPGLGETIGPDGNFSSLSETAKWLLIAGMLIGRLELMAVYILFTLKFWRN